MINIESQWTTYPWMNENWSCSWNMFVMILWVVKATDIGWWQSGERIFVYSHGSRNLMGSMIIDYHYIARKKKHQKWQSMTSGNQDDKSVENVWSVASLPGEIRNIGVGTIRSKYYGLNGSVISDNNPRNCDFYDFFTTNKMWLYF